MLKFSSQNSLQSFESLFLIWCERLPIYGNLDSQGHFELSQEESDLLKAGLNFSIQPDNIRKSEIFTTFEKINRLFLNNLKSEETKSQIKAHLSYLANSYFYNDKPSPSIAS